MLIFTVIYGRGQSLERNCLIRKGTKVIRNLKRTGFFHYAKGIILAILVCLASFTEALSQTPTHPETDAPKKASKPARSHRYVIDSKDPTNLNISLKAEKAKMSEVAQEFSKRLKVPVFLGPERQNELIRSSSVKLTLEPALQLMSPTVYVDYEDRHRIGCATETARDLLVRCEPGRTASDCGSKRIDAVAVD